MIEYLLPAGITALLGMMIWNLKLTREHCIMLERIKEKLGISSA